MLKLTDVYLPKHFTARDRLAVEAFVDGAGAADLVTFDGTKPVASLIPIIWDRPSGAQERLIPAPSFLERLVSPSGASQMSEIRFCCEQSIVFKSAVTLIRLQ